MGPGNKKSAGLPAPCHTERKRHEENPGADKRRACLRLRDQSSENPLQPLSKENSPSSSCSLTWDLTARRELCVDTCAQWACLAARELAGRSGASAGLLSVPRARTEALPGGPRRTRASEPPGRPRSGSPACPTAGHPFFVNLSRLRIGQWLDVGLGLCTSECASPARRTQNPASTVCHRRSSSAELTATNPFCACAQSTCGGRDLKTDGGGPARGGPRKGRGLCRGGAGEGLQPLPCQPVNCCKAQDWGAEAAGHLAPVRAPAHSSGLRGDLWLVLLVQR